MPPSISISRCSAAPPGQRPWHEVPPTPLLSWDGGPDALAEARGPASFRLLSDDTALHVRFDLPIDRPNLAPWLTADKAPGLWDHDVAEIFLAPFPASLPYFEIEGSPLGQLLDYRIDEPRVRIDRDWRSGAQVRGTPALADGLHRIDLSIPFAGLGVSSPAAGTRWRANVFAALGLPGPSRRYLAWSPTHTAAPDFHVPARFGVLLW